LWILRSSCLRLRRRRSCDVSSGMKLVYITKCAVHSLQESSQDTHGGYFSPFACNHSYGLNWTMINTIILNLAQPCGVFVFRVERELEHVCFNRLSMTHFVVDSHNFQSHRLLWTLQQTTVVNRYGSRVQIAFIRQQACIIQQIEPYFISLVFTWIKQLLDMRKWLTQQLATFN
jgi:hypothetical protein